MQENEAIQGSEEDVRILLEFTDDHGNLQREQVWAEVYEGNYVVCNIPFMADGVSWGDLVSATPDENGNLVCREILQPSGHSTVHMMIFKPELTNKIGEDLVALGCDWEVSHVDGYLSVDVQPATDYDEVLSYLVEGFKEKLWDFKESNLKHSSNLNIKKSDFQ